MIDDLLESVKGLIYSKTGDVERLKYIKETLEQGKELYVTDKNYVESLVQKTIPSVVEKTKTEEKKLPREESEIKSIAYRGANHYKSEGTTLVLSLFFGVIGFMGIGHRYVGQIPKALGLLYGGWILSGLTAFLLYPFLASFTGTSNIFYAFGLVSILQQAFQNAGIPYEWSGILASVILIAIPVGYYALLIWQIFDARRICRNYNQFMDETGMEFYEITIAKKIIYAVVFVAPIIISVAFSILSPYIGDFNSLR